jgi:NAD(P)H-hydrate epimerase
VVEVDATAAPAELPSCDLVVDAAYGTGLRGEYHAPRVGPGTPVLAVDIASGVDGLTGALRGDPPRATRTVTFAALKPGLLLEPGRSRCGDVLVADIGLDVSRARAHVVEPSDVHRWLPARAVDAHKWRSAVWVIGGAAGMSGAARLAAGAALRAGAGYVRLSMPGVEHDPAAPTEAVQVPIASDLVLDPTDLGRFGALVVGPGLGRRPGTAEAAQHLIASLAAPVVVDGDGLTALGDRAAALLPGRTHPTILTPHDREFEVLAGGRPGGDRIAAVRALAARLSAVVLLKGPTTVVAEPTGRVLVSLAGDQRLATAGTGDVLAGVIGAFVSRGAPAFEAAAVAAFVHGTAAELGPRHGLVASDLVTLVPRALVRLEGS